MSPQIRGNADPTLEAISQLLSLYETEHPSAEIAFYRQNSASIRVRIIDPDFSGVDRSDRNEKVWQLLDQLPEDVLGQLSVLLLLTSAETAKSFANFEFDDPIPSKL